MALGSVTTTQGAAPYCHTALPSRPIRDSWP